MSLTKNHSSLKLILINGVGWIGNKIAQSLMQKNIDQINTKLIIVDRSKQALENCSNVLKSLYDIDHNKLISCVVDLSLEESFKTLKKLISNENGVLEAIIHTVAIYPRNTITEITSQEWSDVINTNLTSAFFALKHLAPLMKQNNYGRIIFFSSTTGTDFGVSGFAHYSSTKAALEGLVKAAAVELARFGIRINLLCPGNIINHELYKVSKEDINTMISGIPVGRVGKPDDLSYWVDFLLDPKLDFITGQSFRIDGGETLVPKADYVDIKS